MPGATGGLSTSVHSKITTLVDKPPVAPNRQPSELTFRPIWRHHARNRVGSVFPVHSRFRTRS